MTGSQLTVRVAGEDDASTLARLAALDSAALPAGPMLLAEVDGEPVAALPLGGGPAVADPFHRTAAAVELLSLRAAQIRGDGRLAGRRASTGARLRSVLRAPGTVPLR